MLLEVKPGVMFKVSLLDEVLCIFSKTRAECTVWSEVREALGLLEKVSSIVFGVVEIMGILTIHGQEDVLLPEKSDEI